MIVVPYLGVQAYLKNDTIFSKLAWDHHALVRYQLSSNELL